MRARIYLHIASLIIISEIQQMSRKILNFFEKIRIDVTFPGKTVKKSGRPRKSGAVSVSKNFFDTLTLFSELYKVLKMLDFNGAGNPSWVSRAHPSFPLRQIHRSIGKIHPCSSAQPFKYSLGSTALPSLVTAKCRWGCPDSAVAVVPTAPMICPADTGSPASTLGLAWRLA